MALTPEELLELEALELEELEAWEAQQSPPQPAQQSGQQAPPKEKDSWLEDFGEGIATSGLSTYYGIKDLAGQLDDEDRATLADWKEDAGESGWGTAGRVVGELGQFAIPGGALAKGAKAINTAKGLTKAKALGTYAAADALAGASVGGVKLPEEGESRLSNAGREAAASLIGSGVGAAGSKLLRGLDKTPEAKRLIEEGARLTPGMSAATPPIKYLEDVMEVTPFLARGTKKARDAAEDTIQLAALNKASPGAAITETGTEGVAQLKQVIQKEYGDAWAGATGLTNEARTAFVNRGDELFGEVTDAQGNILKRIGSNFKKLTTDPSPESLQAMDKLLRKEINSAKSDFGFQSGLKDLRETLRVGMPEGVVSRLKEVDAQYPDFLTVRKAAKAAAGDGGNFKPRHLVQAMKSVGKDSVGEGAGPMQQFISDASIADQKTGGAPLEFFRRLAGIAPSPLPMKTAGNVLMGNTAPQKAAVGFGNQYADELRKYISSGRVAAALED